jgi:hypothetical protein
MIPAMAAIGGHGGASRDEFRVGDEHFPNGVLTFF